MFDVAVMAASFLVPVPRNFACILSFKFYVQRDMYSF